jgi:hypothetical protein
MLTAGSMVKGGFYFNRDRWDLVAVGGKEGVLPGGEGQRFHRVPAWAALLLAPLAGGLFVVWVPLLGLALLGQYLGRSLLRGGQRARQALRSARVRRGA